MCPGSTRMPRGPLAARFGFRCEQDIGMAQLFRCCRGVEYRPFGLADAWAALRHNVAGPAGRWRGAESARRSRRPAAPVLLGRQVPRGRPRPAGTAL